MRLLSNSFSLFSFLSAEMAAAVITALGLDQPEMLSSLISVLEKDNADSSFVLSCLMWECLVGRSARESRASGLLLPRPSESSSAVLLVTSHHPISHYRNQSLKLGYVHTLHICYLLISYTMPLFIPFFLYRLNLSSLSQKGLFEELDVMKLLSESFSNQSSSQADCVNQRGAIMMQDLFHKIRSKLLKMSENFKSLCLIIGNINDIVLTGVSMSQLFIFIDCLQGLMSEINGLSIVISTHVSNDDSERLMGAFLRHASDLSVTVSGLQTGLSKDVSGILSVSKNDALPSTYHFRLMDRQIKIFSPGAIAV